MFVYFSLKKKEDQIFKIIYSIDYCSFTKESKFISPIFLLFLIKAVPSSVPAAFSTYLALKVFVSCLFVPFPTAAVV